MAARLGLQGLVIVKSARQIQAGVAGNRLAGVAGDPSRLPVGLVQDARSLAALRPRASQPWDEEQLLGNAGCLLVVCAGHNGKQGGRGPLHEACG
jgi:hypothetical protein